VDCNNNYVSIPGETGQSYAPVADGSYAVIVTENSCVDTSACQGIIGVGIAELHDLFKATVYPNPNTGLFNIEVLGNTTLTITIEIWNAIGELVRSEGALTNAMHIIDMGDIVNGAYYVRIKAGQQIIYQPIMIQR